ncbi:MAG: hypothetical protein U0840_00205 [Gemmataceae bacterium]
MMNASPTASRFPGNSLKQPELDFECDPVELLEADLLPVGAENEPDNELMGCAYELFWLAEDGMYPSR